MKIEILHPITHGVGREHKTYGRGVHELDSATAEFFLTHKDSATGQAIAREPVVAKSEAPAGKVEEVARKK
jgi:hypothetical protein